MTLPAGASSGTQKAPQAPQMLALSAPLLAAFRPAKSFLHAEPTLPASAFAAASSSSSGSRARSGSIGQSSSSAAPAESSAVAAARLKSVCSISFDDRGDYVLSAGDDETVQVFSCRAGKKRQAVKSHKYGVHLAKFKQHSHEEVLYASTKVDNVIRHQSIPKNTYITYFHGHQSKVTSLQMSPADETFLSAAIDESVRLWDTRSDQSQALMRIKGHPIVAYDATGSVFAVAINERPTVLLHDVRRFNSPPFLEIQLPPQTIPTSLAFSPQGLLLVGTAGNAHHVMCSKTGAHRYRLCGHEGLKDVQVGSSELAGLVPEAGVSGQETAWTPDGRFVVSGTSTGRLLFWPLPDDGATPGPPAPVQDLQPVSPVERHAGPIRALGFNPRYAMLATGKSQLTFWTPPPPSTDDS